MTSFSSLCIYLFAVAFSLWIVGYLFVHFFSLSRFLARRVQLAKKKANNIAVKLPWEHGGDQNTFHAEDKMTSLRTRDNSSFAINNHYGRLESKLSNDSNVTTVVSDADNKVETQQKRLNKRLSVHLVGFYVVQPSYLFLSFFLYYCENL